MDEACTLKKSLTGKTSLTFKGVVGIGASKKEHGGQCLLGIDVCKL